MLLREANEIFRRAIITSYFLPELEKLGYKAQQGTEPSQKFGALSTDGVLRVFFDLATGSEYPDGDEWFIVEYVLPYAVELPDSLKGPDYFTSLTGEAGERHWRHRELVRFKQGNTKRLTEAVEFIDRKCTELFDTLAEASVIKALAKSAKRSGARPRRRGQKTA